MKKLVFSIVALCACTLAMAQTKIYVCNADGTKDRFVIADVDSIALSKPMFTFSTFSVSVDKKVYFTSGNLRYAQSSKTWFIAPKQYDILATANVKNSALADTIDLFGWSTDGNAATQWGISLSKENSDYSGNFVEWGKNFGDDETLRTLTGDEWTYLLKTRTDATNKYGVAHIKLSDDDSQSVNGLIILPDEWTCPAGVTFEPGTATLYSSQTFTLAQWLLLEQAGALFLPASGFRAAEYVYSYSDSQSKGEGYYWSSTPRDDANANNFYFRSDYVSTPYGPRDHASAVRLVKDAK